MRLLLLYRSFFKVLILLLLGVISTFNSCIDKKEFDFSKLSLSNINPTWVIPLVSDSIGLKTGEYIDFDGDNAVLVLNQKFSGFNLKVLDSLFNLPQQEMNWSNPVSIPSDLDGEYQLSLKYKASTPLKFPTMKDINTSIIRIDSVFIDNLNLAFQPIVLPDMNGNITITIFSLLQQQNPFAYNIPFPSDQNNYQQDNYVLKLSQNTSKGNNILSYQFSMNTSGTFINSAGSTIDIGCNAILRNLKLSKIFSYIGQQHLEVIDSIPMEVKGLAGNVQISSLDVKFEVSNSIGIPVSLNLNELKVVTSNGAERKATDFKPIYIQSGNINQLHTPVTTVDSIDGSKLTPLFGDIPDKFYFNLSLVTNPYGEKPGKTNFLVPDSKVELTTHIRAPLNLSLQDVVFSDTVKFDLSNDWRNKIDDLFFRLHIVNHFPIDILLQASMLDADGNKIGDLFDDPIAINAGTLDNNTSQITASASVIKNIPFNKFRLDQLQHTKWIYFTVKANTSGNGVMKVKIQKKDYVVFKLGVSTIVHLNEVF